MRTDAGSSLRSPHQGHFLDESTPRFSHWVWVLIRSKLDGTSWTAKWLFLAMEPWTNAVCATDQAFLLELATAMARCLLLPAIAMGIAFWMPTAMEFVTMRMNASQVLRLRAATPITWLWKSLHLQLPRHQALSTDSTLNRTTPPTSCRRFLATTVRTWSSTLLRGFGTASGRWLECRWHQ